VAEFLENRKLLRLADLLDDHLLRRLRSNATEVILRLEREDEFTAKRGIALDALRVFKKDMLLASKRGSSPSAVSSSASFGK
jgi:hypothetical protein